MPSLQTAVKRYAFQVLSYNLPRTSHRNASLTSSIERGVRKAANALRTAEKRRVREGTLGFWETKDREKVAHADQNARVRRLERSEREDRLDFLRSGTQEPPSDEHHSEVEHRTFRSIKARDAAARKGMLVEAPAAIPYTKPNSEFLFGTFAVLEALQAKRRRMYNLYLWCGEDGSLVDSDQHTTQIVRLARESRVPLLRVAGSWEKMLDRMSTRRPHNGLVLEASPLPQLPTKVLHSVSSPDDAFTITLNNMSKDEKADFGLTHDAKTYDIPRVARTDRYPFLLWLDKVTDTGNMGAILRTAYFFGVDAVIVPQHGTAPFNAIVIKTSAGAAESIPILKIENELSFIQQSKEKGWKFYAAAATASKSTFKRNGRVEKEVLSPSEMLKSHPCVLLLGNEGVGLRTFLQKEADESIAIEAPKGAGKRIDSLNVSVAAALLTQRFLAA